MTTDYDPGEIRLCPACDGSGGSDRPEINDGTCPVCDGTGEAFWRLVSVDEVDHVKLMNRRVVPDIPLYDIRVETDERSLRVIAALIAAAPEMEALLREFMTQTGACPSCKKVRPALLNNGALPRGWHAEDCKLGLLIARIDAAKAR